MKLLEVEGVGRRFSRRANETQAKIAQIILGAFLPWRGRSESPASHDFWAVRGISFALERGKAIGIIGHNGAGKTTLLKLLTGQILPDEGEIRLRGQVGALIDLMAGFQQDTPGRANIYLRSAMMGRSRAQTDELIEDIIAFSELGDSIEAPFHTYSSGMKMRLAFATTVFMDPDVMIVDEVLSVGDFRFRQKCLERIRQMRSKCAFVLVSHSMQDIARFCNEAIVLERGREVFRGEPADAIHYYESSKCGEPVVTANDQSLLGDFLHNEQSIANVSHEWVDLHGKPVHSVQVGEELRLRVGFELKYDPVNLMIGVPIYADDGRCTTALSSEQSRFAIPAQSGRFMKIIVRVPRCQLVPGRYKSVVAVVDGPEFIYRNANIDLHITRGSHPMYAGDFVIEQNWSIE